MLTHKRKNDSFKLFVCALLMLELIFFILLPFESKGNVRTEETEKYGLLLQSSLFFKPSVDIFADYYNVLAAASTKAPYTPPAPASPLVLLVAKVLNNGFAANDDVADHWIWGMGYAIRDQENGLYAVMIFLLLGTILLFILLFRYLKHHRISLLWSILLAISLLLSGPLLFTFQRGNWILYSLIFVAFFLIFYNHNNKVFNQLAYLSFAIAISIKPYLAALGFVFLINENKVCISKTQLKQILNVIVYFILLLFIPSLLLPDGINSIFKFTKALFNYGDLGFIEESNGKLYLMWSIVNLNVSLFSILPSFYAFLGGGVTNRVSLWFATTNSILCMVLIASTFICVFCSKESWIRLMLACLLMVMIPRLNYYYILIFLTIPLLVYLADGKAKWYYHLLFLIIFNPVQLGYLIPQVPKVFPDGIILSHYLSGISCALFAIVLCGVTIRQMIVAHRKTKAINI